MLSDYCSALVRRYLEDLKSNFSTGTGAMFRRLGFAGAALATLVVALALAPRADAQDFGPAPPPLSAPSLKKFKENPSLLEQTRPYWAPGSPEVTPPGTVTPALPPAKTPPSGPSGGPPLGGGTWTAAVNLPTGNPSLSNPILMADGTVLAHVSCSVTWYKLTPDNTGSYVNGTWTQIADLPNGYTPRFFGSAVLPDGRVIIEGGEYLGNAGCNPAQTKLGAVYDPVADTWTSVNPPSGWTKISDSQGTLLPNGTYMQADCCDNSPLAALLNAGNLTWTATGTSKFDSYDEEGWTLLPNGNLLTVDAYVGTGTCGKGSETYNPSTGAWSSAGTTAGLQLADCMNPSNTSASFEMGPQVLRPDGTVVAFAGTTCADVPNNGVNPNCQNGSISLTSHTAIFNSTNSIWAAGTDLPAVNPTTNCPTPCNYTLADAPAALLPNGSILFAASPNYQTFVKPTHFFEYNSTNAITQVADPSVSASASFNSFQYNFLVLPTGQIMAVQTDGPNVFYYNPTGSPNAAWAPIISSVQANLAAGQTYTISGTQLNGLSQGAYYGDDVQANTNYPLVQVTNTASTHVFYYKTTNSSTYSVAPGTASTASFTVPASAETGPSTLQVVTNGIASQPTNITLFANANSTLSVSTVGNGSVGSSPGGISCGSTCSANFATGAQVSLTATPASGWSFTGWSGACGGSGGCGVTMAGNQAVIATFTQNSFTLTASETGSGTITSSDGQIGCGQTCNASYLSGTQVSLTAAPAAGWSFTGWGGACSGTGGCTVTMNAATSVSATFTQSSFALSVSVSPSGSGAVGSSPPGINCGSTCSASYLSNTVVSLTETPANGFAFAGWGGACSGVGTCIVTMSAAQNVSASFTQGTAPTSPLLAAILPSSRSAVVNNTVTAFATIINTGPSATGCAIAPIGDPPLNFVYQTTNPQTNALTGAANTPVNISGSNGVQTFVIALMPTATFNPVQLPFSFACSNVAPAPIQTGLNTLLLSSSATPVPDIVALGATTLNDGILHIPGSSGANAFAVATVNVGAAGAITVTANTGSATLPLAITLCQTDPASGQCINPSAPAPSATTTINANATPTFAIFGQASGAIPFDPANSRIFVQFTDGGGTVRGATSVAVETQ
jgi:hypothetical protein